MAQAAFADERLVALRQAIARLEAQKSQSRFFSGKLASGEKAAGVRGEPHPALLSLGVPSFDRLLGGGLPLAGLTEIRNGETRDIGAATGFTAALAVLCQAESKDRRHSVIFWIAERQATREAGLPDGVGLQAYGLDTSRFLLGHPHRITDALWMAEAALSSCRFAAVVLEIRSNPACFGLRESRRLHLRAQASRIPLLLLRQSGEEEASSALLRLHVCPAPARARIFPEGQALPGSIGNPVFHVTAEKSRAIAPAGFLMEWNSNDRRFYECDAALAPVGPAYSLAELSASVGRPRIEDEMGKVMAFNRAS
ncbi:MAG: hypothetical protein QHC90_21420 [Shinella sp.]|nr:hypothetical protein [Shinella sp.]